MPGKPRKLTPIEPRRLVRLFERDGWRETGRAGRHITLTKPGFKRPVTISFGRKPISPGVIRVNMRTAEMTRRRYFELLDEV